MPKPTKTAKQSNGSTLVSQFFIAGMIYSEYGSAKLKRGQRLSLIKESENPHDSNAITINTLDRVFIGWVPRNQTYEIRNFRGKVTRAIIHAYEPSHPTHRRVLVRVYGVLQSEVQSKVIC